MINLAITYVCDMGDGTTVTVPSTLNPNQLIASVLPGGWQVLTLTLDKQEPVYYLCCPNHAGGFSPLPKEVQPIITPVEITNVTVTAPRLQAGS